MIEVIVYTNKDGEEPFTKWLLSQNNDIKALVNRRLRVVERGSLGFWGSVGSDLYELKFQNHSGTRVYYGKPPQANDRIVLLNGGKKDTQGKDIRNAKAYWVDYKEEIHEKI